MGIQHIIAKWKDQARGFSSYAYVPADYPSISSCRLRTSCLTYYEIGHSKTWASKTSASVGERPNFRSYTEYSPLCSYYGLSATRSTGWTEVRRTYAHTVPSITLETREKCRRVFSGIHRLVQRVAGNHEWSSSNYIATILFAWWWVVICMCGWCWTTTTFVTTTTTTIGTSYCPASFRQWGILLDQRTFCKPSKLSVWTNWTAQFDLVRWTCVSGRVVRLSQPVYRPWYTLTTPTPVSPAKRRFCRKIK